MKKDFTQIYNKVIIDNKISDAAFRTLLLLLSYKFGKNKVFPSQITLSKQRKKSTRTIISHMNELRKAGYITYKKRGYSASNEYKFIREINFTTEIEGLLKNFTSYEKKTSSQSRNKFHSNNITNNTENKNVLKGLRNVINKNPIMRLNYARLLTK